MKIIVDEEFCKGCQLCINQCPKNVLVISSHRNNKGYLVPIVEDEDNCNTCQLCECICPDMAITVMENNT